MRRITLILTLLAFVGVAGEGGDDHDRRRHHHHGGRPSDTDPTTTASDRFPGGR